MLDSGLILVKLACRTNIRKFAMNFQGLSRQIQGASSIASFTAMMKTFPLSWAFLPSSFFPLFIIVACIPISCFFPFFPLLLVPERLRIFFFSVVKVCKHWLVEEQYVWRRVATQISTLAAWSSGQSAGLEARKSQVRVPLPAVWNPRPRSVNSQFFFCLRLCLRLRTPNAFPWHAWTLRSVQLRAWP